MNNKRNHFLQILIHFHSQSSDYQAINESSNDTSEIDLTKGLVSFRYKSVLLRISIIQWPP